MFWVELTDKDTGNPKMLNLDRCKRIEPLFYHQDGSEVGCVIDGLFFKETVEEIRARLPHDHWFARPRSR